MFSNNWPSFFPLYLINSLILCWVLKNTSFVLKYCMSPSLFLKLYLPFKFKSRCIALMLDQNSIVQCISRSSTVDRCIAKHHGSLRSWGKKKKKKHFRSHSFRRRTAGISSSLTQKFLALFTQRVSDPISQNSYLHNYQQSHLRTRTQSRCMQILYFRGRPQLYFNVISD